MDQELMYSVGDGMVCGGTWNSHEKRNLCVKLWEYETFEGTTAFLPCFAAFFHLAQAHTYYETPKRW